MVRKQTTNLFIYFMLAHYLTCWYRMNNTGRASVYLRSIHMLSSQPSSGKGSEKLFWATRKTVITTTYKITIHNSYIIDQIVNLINF
jgi:hypothetical protein